jgi:hypothetical protein
MRKLTTKILGDMLMKKADQYQKNFLDLYNKFKQESDFIIAANDLIIKFPNLQISNNLITMWTQDVNELVTDVYLRSEINFPYTLVYAYPYVVINNHRIYGFDPYHIVNLDNEYSPFYISNKDNKWKDNMKNLKIPDKIIEDISLLINK